MTLRQHAAIQPLDADRHPGVFIIAIFEAVKGVASLAALLALAWAGPSTLRSAPWNSWPQASATTSMRA